LRRRWLLTGREATMKKMLLMAGIVFALTTGLAPIIPHQPQPAFVDCSGNNC
jgi:hypothetical protein